MARTADRSSGGAMALIGEDLGRRIGLESLKRDTYRLSSTAFCHRELSGAISRRVRTDHGIGS
jgi:hypothetical protein